MKRKLISLLLCLTLLLTLLPTAALAVTETVSFQINTSNGASGTVSYRFGDSGNFETVTLNNKSVDVPSDKTTITVKAEPATGSAVNQGRSGVYTNGNLTTNFDFTALTGEGFTYTLEDASPRFQIEFDNNDGTVGGNEDNSGGIGDYDIFAHYDENGGSVRFSLGTDQEEKNFPSDSRESFNTAAENDIPVIGTVNLKVTPLSQDASINILVRYAPTTEDGMDGLDTTVVRNGNLEPNLPEDLFTWGNNVLSFTPPSHNGVAVEIWWTESSYQYDMFGPEGDKSIIVEAESYGDGQVSWPNTIAQEDMRVDGNRTKARVNPTTFENGLPFTWAEEQNLNQIRVEGAGVDGGWLEVAPDKNQTSYAMQFNQQGKDFYRVEFVFEGGGPGEGDPTPQNGIQFQLHGPERGSVLYKIGEASDFTSVSNTGEDSSDINSEEIPLDENTTVTFKVTPEATNGYFEVHVSSSENEQVTVNPDDSQYADFMKALAAGSSASFMAKAGVGYSIRVDFGQDELPWYTVSWGGGNVTVENGTVRAERVHLGEKIFTVNAEESGASDSDQIFPIEDIIGKEGQEGLGGYGLGFGDTDLFIGNDVEERVSIDFKFVPKYGYQLSDILTNEKDSLLNGFTANKSEISTFNFAVRPEGGNVHFNVVFAAAEDTIDVTGSEKVTGATIENGGNATDSGNLKMTVADLDPNDVSNELKTQAGESALYLNMDLFQVVSKAGREGQTEESNWETQLENLPGTITVTLRVPAPTSGNSYYIIREHGNGETKEYSRIAVTFVPDENDSTMGTVTFETDRFSNYALAQETVTPSIPDNTPSTPSNSTTTTNLDGSTTTTVTDKTTGTVTETTKNTDGSTSVVETKKDGTITETVKTADGTTGTVVIDKSGTVTEVKASVSATAAKEAGKTGGAVTLPVEVPSVKTTSDAPAVDITMPVSSGSVKVEVPVEKVTPGTVAVLVKADGTEEIVKTSVPGSNGVVLKLDSSATLKIVDNAKTFVDVRTSEWHGDAVDFVSARSIFDGNGDGTFTPNSSMTRAMLMNVLARYEGADTAGGTTWYEKGMNWAVENGISDGSDPDKAITREQLATMLYRYAGSPNSSQELSFPDAGNVSDYAQPAIRWAVENGLISGMDGTLNPQGYATRAQVASIMMRFSIQALD